MAAGSFPFATYREGQREAIDRVRASFEDGARFVVVEAPTGSGKSAIAVTLAREAKSAYILTIQKVLQDQYVRDFPDLAVMKGRSNYPCLVTNTHAAAAPCIVGKRFPACEACPYFTAKDVAMAASSVALNYAYYLAELNYGGGFGERDLLILDEAHNAEAALMAFAQVSLSEAELMRAGISRKLPPPLGDEGYFDFVEDLLPELHDRTRQLELELAKVSSFGAAATDLLRHKQWLDARAVRMRMMIDSRAYDGAEWIVERRRTEGGDGVVFKPVEVAPFAEELLFKGTGKVLLMSATILDVPTFLRGIGIEPGTAALVQVPSSFPAANRPLVLRPSARLTRHYLEKELPRLVAAVSEVAQAHAREKGVIHAHSYRIARAIETGLPEDQRWRLVTHRNAADREVALTRHLSSPEPTILLSPSMTEGIDLGEDLARWQVLCKVPYPNLGDVQVKHRAERDPSWYDWRTCLSVVQAYGRSVRSRDDRATTYLLDADFPAFIRRHRSKLPEWFLEALREDDDGLTA